MVTEKVIKKISCNMTYITFQLFVCFVCLYLARQPPRGPGPPHKRGFSITHNDASQSVGLLWTSDQLVAGTST